MEKVTALKTMAAKVTSQKHIQEALVSYLLWLTWHSGDHAGATNFASDNLSTEADIDVFASCLKVLVVA